MKFKLPRFFVIFFLFYSAFSQTETVRVKVETVHDGDSLTVSDASKRSFKIRLIGIDAPELKQDFGGKARKQLKKLLKLDKKNIIVKPFGLDRYNRILALIFVGGLNVNLELLKNGSAWVYDSKELGKEQSGIYAEAMSEARRKKIGLWKDDGAVEPKEFRKKKHKND
jgi:micrococcal nuclease